MKIIQVGAGSWGASWLRIVQQSLQWELAALIEIDVAARDEAARISGLSADRCFARLEDALDAGIEADTALVIVPPPFHAPVAIAALESGLDCLIEKPLANTMSAAREIVAAVDRTGRRAMVSQNYRFKRAPRTVRRLIRSGVIGRVEQIRVDFQKDPPFTGFRVEMEEPLIVDMAIHHLDQIRSVTGSEFHSLRARSWNPSWSRFGGNACCFIEIQSEDGVQIVYTGSWVSRGRHTTWDGAWEIQGDRGCLIWDSNRVEIRFASVFDTVFLPGALERAGGVMEVQLDEVDFEERLGTLAEFADAITQGRPAETSVHDNLKSLALVLAAVESATAGGKTIDLAAMTEQADAHRD